MSKGGEDGPGADVQDAGAEAEANGMEEVMVGGGRPDFENWNQGGILGDEENEEAIQYFTKSVINKQRTMAEDEKENDVSKFTDGGSFTLRQHINRRKVQLI